MNALFLNLAYIPPTDKYYTAENIPLTKKQIAVLKVMPSLSKSQSPKDFGITPARVAVDTGEKCTKSVLGALVKLGRIKKYGNKGSARYYRDA